MAMIPNLDFQITPTMLHLIAQIEEFRGQWKSTTLLNVDILKKLRFTATVESIGSSTRIEGSALTDDEVRELLGNLGVQSFHTRDEQEVAGYAEAMNLIFDSFTEIPITENHLQQLHSILLQYSTKDQRHKGKYKTLLNTVAAFDESGKELGVIFQTATPFETPQSMRALLSWYHEACQDRFLHPLLIISIFIVWFLAIHPFQDGNGRLSRILTTLLLLKSGYVYVPYVSMESIIESQKDRYYASLRATQTTFSLDQTHWEPWVTFFLRCLIKQTDILKAKIELTQKMLSVPDLSLRILKIFTTQENITLADCIMLTGGKKGTLKLHLSKLVKNGQLRMHGKGRGSFYTRV